MRTLFLHMGMHKTGTSSIQQTLHAHRALLAEHGLSWFEDAEANHSRTVFSAFTEQPHLYHANRRLGLHRAEDAAAHAADCRDRLVRFLREAPGPGLLLSGEDMGMLGRDGIGRMLAAFRPQVDRIIAIGMVRPPRSFVASAMQQRIRGGDRLEEIADGGVAPSYRRRFEPFLTAPEIAELRLHLYEPATLDHGCSVATFLRLIGADPALYPRLVVDRANRAPPHLGILLTLAANEEIPVFQADGAPNPERAIELVRLLERLPGPRWELPASLIAPRIARYAEDIAWMETQLGQPFAAAEKDPTPPAAPEPALHTLDWDEVRVLARTMNRLLQDLTTTREALRRARSAAAAPPPGQGEAADARATDNRARPAVGPAERQRQGGGARP